MLISDQLLDSLQGGLSLLVATCDAAQRPVCSRGVGLHIWPNRLGVTLFLPQATAAQTLANLEEQSNLAFVLSRPDDYHTVQMKGVARGVREALAEERELVARFVRTFAELVDGLGVPRALAQRVAHWPCWAVDVELSEVFLQTPGPGAGTPLGSAGP